VSGTRGLENPQPSHLSLFQIQVKFDKFATHLGDGIEERHQEIMIKYLVIFHVQAFPFPHPLEFDVIPSLSFIHLLQYPDPGTCTTHYSTRDELNPQQGLGILYYCVTVCLQSHPYFLLHVIVDILLALHCISRKRKEMDGPHSS